MHQVERWSSSWSFHLACSFVCLKVVELGHCDQLGRPSNPTRPLQHLTPCNLQLKFTTHLRLLSQEPEGLTNKGDTIGKAVADLINDLASTKHSL